MSERTAGDKRERLTALRGADLETIILDGDGGNANDGDWVLVVLGLRTLGMVAVCGIVVDIVFSWVHDTLSIARRQN